MNNSPSSLSDEALSELIVLSSASRSRTHFSTDDVSERIRKFAELYDALAEKPAGTAILFRDPETESIRCHPVDKELVVGRLPKSERQPTACDLAVADSTLSREHFRITNADGLYLLSDLDSLNGTFLDDKRLPCGESVALIAGSMIRAGDVIFVFSGKT